MWTVDRGAVGEGGGVVCRKAIGGRVIDGRIIGERVTGNGTFERALDKGGTSGTSRQQSSAVPHLKNCLKHGNSLCARVSNIYIYTRDFATSDQKTQEGEREFRAHIRQSSTNTERSGNSIKVIVKFKVGLWKGNGW